MVNFCEKCGSKLNVNEKFCPNCGNRVEFTQPIDENSIYQYNTDSSSVLKTKNKKPKKEIMNISKRKKAKIIMLSVLSLLLVFVIGVATLLFTSPAFNVYKDIKKGNYDNALTNYNIDVRDDSLQEFILDLTMKDYAEVVIENFKDKEITYESALEIINILEQMKIEGISEKKAEIVHVQSVNDAMEKGEKYYLDSEYGKAIQEYLKITEDNENYKTAQAKLNEIYPKYVEDVNKKALENIANKFYESAISLINTALEIIPEEIDVSTLNATRDTALNNYKAKIISDVTTFIDSGKYTDAVYLVNNALKIDDNEEFKILKQTAESKYVEDVVKTVQKYLNSEDYISASRTLDAAVEFLPDNPDLSELKTKVENETPIYLLDVCKPYTTERYTEYINGETFKMAGKSYTNGFTLTCGDYVTGLTLFNLNSEYESVSFLVGHCDDTNMNDAILKIYCDNVLVLEEKLLAQDLPHKISIDITGVSQLKIELLDAYYPVYGFGNVIVK